MNVNMCKKKESDRALLSENGRTKAKRHDL